MERRLAAIVVADVVGFSRMVAEDETATINRMRELRDTVTEPTIKTTGGRIVKRTGDGTLVEFSSVLDAVNAAIKIQHQLLNQVKQLHNQQQTVQKMIYLFRISWFLIANQFLSLYK